MLTAEPQHQQMQTTTMSDNTPWVCCPQTCGFDFISSRQHVPVLNEFWFTVLSILAFHRWLVCRKVDPWRKNTASTVLISKTSFANGVFLAVFCPCRKLRLLPGLATWQNSLHGNTNGKSRTKKSHFEKHPTGLTPSIRIFHVQGNSYSATSWYKKKKSFIASMKRRNDHTTKTTSTNCLSPETLPCCVVVQHSVLLYPPQVFSRLPRKLTWVKHIKP